MSLSPSRHHSPAPNEAVKGHRHIRTEALANVEVLVLDVKRSVPAPDLSNCGDKAVRATYRYMVWPVPARLSAVFATDFEAPRMPFSMSGSFRVWRYIAITASVPAHL